MFRIGDLVSLTKEVLDRTNNTHWKDAIGLVIGFSCDGYPKVRWWGYSGKIHKSPINFEESLKDLKHV